MVARRRGRRCQRMRATHTVTTAVDDGRTERSNDGGVEHLHRHIGIANYHSDTFADDNPFASTRTAFQPGRR